MNSRINPSAPNIEGRLASLLEGAGFNVETASDAVQGFGRVAAGGIEAVFIGLMLPGDSGFDLCRRIKNDEAFKTVPVILVTAFGDPQEVLKLYTGNRHMMEGLEMEVMEDQVVEWLLDHAKITDQPISFSDLMKSE